MKVISVKITGFRSFTNPQTWSVGNRAPGLYQVAGRNDVEPDLEANGAGKSTLFEAIYWCLYGRTSRGLKAGNVQSWTPGSPKCRVAVMLRRADGLNVTVVRAWNPNSLTVVEEIDDGHLGINDALPRPIDQAELETLVGINPEAFLQTIYHAQFSPSFVDLAPAERLSLLSGVLNLDHWEQAAQVAGEHAKSLDAQVIELNTELASVKGRLAELDPTRFNTLIATWDADHNEEVAAAQQALDDSIDRETKLRRSATTLERAQPSAGAAAEVDLPSLEGASTDAQTAYTTASAVVSERAARVRQFTTEQQQLSGVDTSKRCSRCRQIISGEHIQRELSAVAELLTVAKGELETANLAVEQTQDLVVATRAQVAAGRKQAADAAVARATAQAQIDAARRELKSVQQLLAAQQITLDRSKNKPNPYRAEQQRAQEAVTTLGTKSAKLTADLNDAAGLATAARYWVTGFKQIRLFVVEQVLSQLEVEVNNTLVQLGLTGWAIQFSVEQETKSGTVKRGFLITVLAPHAKDGGVPFESWSGGESQRLRLAISMGLSDLILGYLGVQSNLEFWDEPSTWLSASGIQEMLGVLHDRARRNQTQLWLADHRSLDYGQFAGVITVVKRKEGSVLDGGLDGGVVQDKRHDEEPSKKPPRRVLHSRKVTA